MANIKLLNLESPSSLSELTHKDTDGITGGAIQQYYAIRRAGGSRSFAQRVFNDNYVANRRGGATKRQALAASLSSPG